LTHTHRTQDAAIVDVPHADIIIGFSETEDQQQKCGGVATRSRIDLPHRLQIAARRLGYRFGRAPLTEI
jgi:hypothetical protein